MCVDEDASLGRIGMPHYINIYFQKVNLVFFAETLAAQRLWELLIKRLIEKTYPAIKVSWEICRLIGKG
ncbi:hypothetical protein [Bacillus sp. THAF10]|uniref:hypothetical protein n=1 Tax=Bacillus sp. THAF10 TaxID=2587848 RepID=UPI0012698582|nr:hypothetical protein [Bacillus sp. THAF10]